VKLTKKLKIERADANDIIKKLIKGISKLVLTATQAVTEKVTITIRQMPTYIINNFAPFSKQTGR
jgi:phenylpyruvate tautomerase PptA (4-oxalocrotonate tautomerase family)